MKLPRPKFGLKTLFVAITAICVFLYWVETQRNLVRARQDFMRNTSCQTWIRTTPNPPDIPWVHKVLGDKAYSAICLPENSDANAQSTALSLFPEAKSIYVAEVDAGNFS